MSFKLKKRIVHYEGIDCRLNTGYLERGGGEGEREGEREGGREGGRGRKG